MNLSSKRNSFNSKEAILLAAFSYQTYVLYQSGKINLPKGYVLKYTIFADANVENPTNEVFGFIAESSENVIIAFRGYASYPADLIAAYDILQVPYPYVENAGKTSRGFTCIYQSTRKKLLKEINKLSKKKSLFITGHNYGGALATLATLDLVVNTKFENIFVYTYGSPRVGNPKFVFKFHQIVRNSNRVVNIHDSFPTFPEKVYPPPFTEEGLYYEHVNTKYPLSFQLNDTPRNDGIGCYFKNLSKLNPDYSEVLCSENPEFCPNSEMCFPFQRTCNCPKPCQ
ncbi:lipase family protein [Bacillus sp. AFS053548]|uniref:lipase family protein n=1 Tax=Bacillus sp. AFS053548 TaxID=2033505 RepID=UPI000BFD2A74|nr:lipase family protein [Bacillus sp. AFS053548]PGM55117.1 lipase [Bacillus sp. AFS053548]